MKIKKNIIDQVIWITNKENRNLLEKVIRKTISTCCPRVLTKIYYSINEKNKKYWNGKKCCFTLSFDCDLENDYEAMPLLLETLNKYSLKASFACIGKWVEKLPEIHRQMVDQGHEIVNHSYTHPSNIYFHPNERFNQLTTDERETEITKADHVFKDVLGYKPVGFRTPHFGDSHTNDIYGILKKLGYKYSSSTVAIKTPEYGNPFLVDEEIWEFPLSIDPTDIFSCFDTWTRFKGPRGKLTEKTERKFFDHLRWITEIGISTGSYINVYFDPADINLLKEFKEFIRFLSGLRRDVWIAKYEEILPEIDR